MSGQTMTMREVADLCEVDRTTVLRWIGKIENGALRTEIGAKCTEADEAKKPARFDLREVLAIINAGGKHTMAALLAENAKGATARPAHKLPAGIQLRELRLMAEKKILSAYQVQQVLGVAQPALPGPAPERPASPSEIEAGFAAIRAQLASDRPALPPGTVDRLAGAAASAAAGATRRAFAAIVERRESDRTQPTLGGMS